MNSQDTPRFGGHEFGPRHHGEGHGRVGPRGFGPMGFGPGGFGPRGFGPRGFGPRGFGPGGFGPGGFGPGGFGPGGFRPGPEGAEDGPGEGRGGRGRPGFGPGFGPKGFGPGRGGHGRSRRQRGNVRIAVLALLAEEPRHGYAIMTELAERSGGLWRPSPGSVYPVLQQLQDEGLVSVQESEGRRVFSLTETGRAYVAEHADEAAEPWNVAAAGPRERVRSLMHAGAALAMAVEQVARLSDDAQAARALAVLEEARRSMYRILAGDEPAGPAPAAGEPEPPVEPSGAQ